MKRTLLCLVGVGTLTVSLTAPGAEGPGPPPKLLQIYREEVKPGKVAAHEKLETGWPAAFAKANWSSRYLAITSMTGPAEAWFITGYPSMAAWEKDTKALEGNKALTAEMDALSEKDGELLSGGSSLLLSFREDLSNDPTIDVAKMRYFRIVTFRLRPGHDTDFTSAVGIVRDAYKKANVALQWAVYQVVAGMPGPTYTVWIPMKSLEEVDASMAAAKAIQDAEGEEGQKSLAKAASDGYASTTQNLYAFSPRMSYPPKEWVASDPEYWASKAAGATPPAEKKKPAEKK